METWIVGKVDHQGVDPDVHGQVSLYLPSSASAGFPISVSMRDLQRSSAVENAHFQSFRAGWQERAARISAFIILPKRIKRLVQVGMDGSALG